MWLGSRGKRVKLPVGTGGSVTGIVQTLVVGACGADCSTGLESACGVDACTTVWGSSLAAAWSRGRLDVHSVGAGLAGLDLVFGIVCVGYYSLYDVKIEKKRNCYANNDNSTEKILTYQFV